METNGNEDENKTKSLPIPTFKRYRSCGTGFLYLTTSHTTSQAILHLQSIGQSLVQLGDLGRNAEVDSAVTNLNNESTNKVGVNLGDNLELLALADLGLGDGLLETGDGLVVELLNYIALASPTKTYHGIKMFEG